MTDAVLTKAEAHRLSIMAHDGLARALLPAHLPADGDTVFAAATGKVPLTQPAAFMELCHLATMVMARAVARGRVRGNRPCPVTGAQKAWRGPVRMRGREPPHLAAATFSPGAAKGSKRRPASTHGKASAYTSSANHPSRRTSHFSTSRTASMTTPTATVTIANP